MPIAKTQETPNFFFVDIIDCQIQVNGNNNIEKSENKIMAATVIYSVDASTQWPGRVGSQIIAMGMHCKAKNNIETAR